MDDGTLMDFLVGEKDVTTGEEDGGRQTYHSLLDRRWFPSTTRKKMISNKQNKRGCCRSESMLGMLPLAGSDMLLPLIEGAGIDLTLPVVEKMETSLPTAWTVLGRPVTTEISEEGVNLLSPKPIAGSMDDYGAPY
ncbi:hypothetical protein ACLOJK_024343 [Asimina triloba]